MLNHTQGKRFFATALDMAMARHEASIVDTRTWASELAPDGADRAYDARIVRALLADATRAESV